MKLCDTTFLIDLIRGDQRIRHHLKEPLVTTQINIFEVLRGLFLRRPSDTQYAEILDLFSSIHILPLHDSAIIRSAEISAQLIKKGEPLPDADCLIAGIALANKVSTVLTRNKKHFERIEGIQVESY